MEGIDPLTGLPYSGEDITERQSHLLESSGGGGPGGNLFGGGGGRSIFSGSRTSGSPPTVSEPAPTSGDASVAPPQSALSRAERLEINRAAGAAFEKKQLQIEEEQGHVDVSPQVTVRTTSGTKTRFDIMARDPSSGDILCIECKSSDTAPVRPNQNRAFQEIEESGATVVGRGKPSFPGGTVIPPTRVQIIRPSRKMRMSIDQTNVVDFIYRDPKTNEVYLCLTDHLAWTGVQKVDYEHLYLLQEKINSYLAFIESGEIYTAYPKAKGRTLIIQVIGKYDMNSIAQDFFDLAQQKALAAGYQLKFELGGNNTVAEPGSGA
jgi:hypothetical protein